MAEPDTSRSAVVARAAERLMAAAGSVTPAAPVRDLLGTTDITLAYEVQNVLTAARLRSGARIAGRKIGLTAPAVQQQLGVDQPDFGVLFDDMLAGDGSAVDSSRLIAPKAEGEIAFVLAADLAGSGEGSALGAPVSAQDRAAAAAAVGYAVAAIEIVDSRVAGWDIRITDTIADNASSAMFVLGGRQVPLRDFVPAEVTMTMTRNGAPVSSGTGAACLGDPLNALAWLARTASALGAPLRAGEVVLSGALGPMVAVSPGDEVGVELSGLGRVQVTFSG